MSAFDIVGVVAAAMQFSIYITKIVNYIDQNKKAGKDYHESLVELQSKLKLFQRTLDSLQRIAETIKWSENRTEMESIALVPMKEAIEETEKILKQLFTCQEKYQRPNDCPSLMLVMHYWVFEHKGKIIVKNGINEITDRVEAIKILLAEILTHVAIDGRDVTHDVNKRLCEQMTSDHPLYSRTGSSGWAASNTSNPSAKSWGSTASESADITTRSDFETESWLKHLASQWDIDLPMDEEVATVKRSDLSAIITAIKEKNYKIVARLLQSVKDPLAKDDNGWCAFHYAVRVGSKTVMRELLDSQKVKESRGFDIGDSNGDTALHFASLLGMEAMAKELLKAGCNKNALNNSGHSPLSIAVNKKKVGIVEILLEYKAECIPPNPEILRKIRNEINYLKDIAAFPRKPHDSVLGDKKGLLLKHIYYKMKSTIIAAFRTTKWPATR
ncbi:ankyrin [Hyaloscypha bicolor E]|uniref:Ankyrin n=1 Tax=Hyaloscypha bicolor E TaxID=1095630 RepID=A0A2J6SK04_9HELO|nr:ankyrin [Hyaloscypha bicolor E]PMD51096.1 ankyrin [Hyaloscypha bicolor E]